MCVLHMVITGMLLQCGEYVLIFIYTKTLTLIKMTYCDRGKKKILFKCSREVDFKMNLIGKIIIV